MQPDLAAQLRSQAAFPEGVPVSRSAGLLQPFEWLAGLKWAVQRAAKPGFGFPVATLWQRLAALLEQVLDYKLPGPG